MMMMIVSSMYGHAMPASQSVWFLNGLVLLFVFTIVLNVRAQHNRGVQCKNFTGAVMLPASRTIDVFTFERKIWSNTGSRFLNNIRIKTESLFRNEYLNLIYNVLRKTSHSLSRGLYWPKNQNLSLFSQINRPTYPYSTSAVLQFSQCQYTTDNN